MLAGGVQRVERVLEPVDTPCTAGGIELAGSVLMIGSVLILMAVTPRRRLSEGLSIGVVVGGCLPR